MKKSSDDMANILIGANLVLDCEEFWVSKVRNKPMGKEVI